MTRCVCCNKNLSKKDSVIRYQSTGEFADLCGECRYEIGPDVSYIIPDMQDEFYDDENLKQEKEEDDDNY